MIVRNNQIELVWRVEYNNKHFKQVIFVRGTEDEVRDYMESEFGFMGKYHACADKEVDAIETLRMPIYIAPKINRY